LPLSRRAYFDPTSPLRTLPRATTVTRDGQKLYKLCRVVARGYSMSETVEMTV
jgi:hypothetical protein